MRPEDLREFARRSREPVAVAKREHWRAAHDEDSLAAFEAGQVLYAHARSLGRFPSEQYLAEDLAHHIRLKELIDRASQALAAPRPPR